MSNISEMLCNEGLYDITKQIIPHSNCKLVYNNSKKEMEKFKDGIMINMVNCGYNHYTNKICLNCYWKSDYLNTMD